MYFQLKIRTKCFISCLKEYFYVLFFFLVCVYFCDFECPISLHPDGFVWYLIPISVLIPEKILSWKLHALNPLWPICLKLQPQVDVMSGLASNIVIPPNIPECFLFLLGCVAWLPWWLTEPLVIWISLVFYAFETVTHALSGINEQAIHDFLKKMSFLPVLI